MVGVQDCLLTTQLSNVNLIIEEISKVILSSNNSFRHIDDSNFLPTKFILIIQEFVYIFYLVKNKLLKYTIIIETA